jgi:hypothetical protein
MPYTELDSNAPSGASTPAVYSGADLANVRAMRDMVIGGRVAGFLQARTTGTGPGADRPQYLAWLNSTLQVGVRLNITWGGPGNWRPTAIQWEYTTNNGANWDAMGSAQAFTWDKDDNLTATSNSGGISGLLFELWTKALKAISQREGVSLTPDANMAVSGNSFKKVAGGAAWNAQVYSRVGYQGGCWLSFVVANAATGFSRMVGLNTDPTTDAHYTSIDFAIHINGSTGNAEAYESGSGPLGSATAVAVGDVLTIVYDGQYVRYWKNATLIREVSAAADLTLYLDSSFYEQDGEVTNVQFGPLTPQAPDPVGSTLYLFDNFGAI